jgi:TetR/AcrR family transcriptional regulator
MVQVLHSGENKKKLEEILLEARKLFGLYGFERTTMQEISNHLAVSKAALYYYFPDKESLFRAVIEREQDRFFHSLARKLSTMKKSEDRLAEFIRQRHDHFRKFTNLNIFRYSRMERIRPLIMESFRIFREREKQVIVSIIDRGIRSHEFRCSNPVDTAQLFLDVLHGIRLMVMNFRDYSDLKPKDYSQIEQKHMQFLDLFKDSLRVSKQ